MFIRPGQGITGFVIWPPKKNNVLRESSIIKSHFYRIQVRLGARIRQADTHSEHTVQCFQGVLQLISVKEPILLY